MMGRAAGALEEAVSETNPSAIAVAMLASELAGGERTARLVVSGTCMTPLIDDGDTVLVRGVTGELPCGTIVVARNPKGRLVCHRFLGCADGTTGWLAAENSLSAELVPLQSIIGIVTTVCREDGSLDLSAGPWRIADKALSYLHRMLPPTSLSKPIWVRWALTAAGEIRRIGFHLCARLRWRLGRTPGPLQEINYKGHCSFCSSAQEMLPLRKTIERGRSAVV